MEDREVIAVLARDWGDPLRCTTIDQAMEPARGARSTGEGSGLRRALGLPIIALLALGACDELISDPPETTPDPPARATSHTVVVAWNELARNLVSVHRTNPPVASRAYALLSVAQYDALKRLREADGAGAHGIAVLGNVTEYMKLTTAERIELMSVVGEAIGGRVPYAVTVGEVSVAGQRAFCPISQIDIARNTDPAQHEGRVYEFRIIEFKEGGPPPKPKDFPLADVIELRRKP